jgi:hypothetical protein
VLTPVKVVPPWTGPALRRNMASIEKHGQARSAKSSKCPRFQGNPAHPGMTKRSLRRYAGALAQALGDVAGLADGGFGGCAAARPTVWCARPVAGGHLDKIPAASGFWDNLATARLTAS